MRALCFVFVALVGVEANASAYVIGDIAQEALAPAAQGIESTGPGDIVDLYFNSPGGYVEDGLDFIRTMERAQARGAVFICTADLAASMGAVIFSACDVRLVIPRARVLIHPVSAGMSRGSHKDLRELADYLETSTHALYWQIARVLHIPFAELKRRAGDRDYWFDSVTAVEIGFAHLVLP